MGTAESLTGGMICSVLVDVPGASAVVKGAIVAYTEEVKIQVLGARAQTIAEHTAVSPEMAREMASGAARSLRCDVAISSTGVAGPGPADGSQAGTVHLAVHTPRGLYHRRVQLAGDRSEVRQQATRAALQLVMESLEW